MATTNKYALVRFDHRTAEVIKGTEFELPDQQMYTLYAAIGRGVFEYASYRDTLYTRLLSAASASSDMVARDKIIQYRMDDAHKGLMSQMRLLTSSSRLRVWNQVVVIGKPLGKWTVEEALCLPGEKLEVFLVQVDPTYWVGGQ